MSIWQKIMVKFFGWEYVVLIFHDGDRKLCRAYKLGLKIYAHPYLPHTRCELLPGGKTAGKSYIVGWSPVTHKTMKLFSSGSVTEPRKAN